MSGVCVRACVKLCEMRNFHCPSCYYSTSFESTSLPYSTWNWKTTTPQGLFVGKEDWFIEQELFQGQCKNGFVFGVHSQTYYYHINITSIISITCGPRLNSNTYSLLKWSRLGHMASLLASTSIAIHYRFLHDQVWRNRLPTLLKSLIRTVWA